MSHQTVFENAAARAGWNESSQTEILQRYIDRQDSAAAFTDFISEKVAAECGDDRSGGDFDEAVAQTGWNDATKVAVLLEYVGNQDDIGTFKDFLEQEVGNEENASIELGDPGSSKFLVCDGWGHLFGPGKAETNTRWVMERQSVTLVAAQFEQNGQWLNLRREDVADLLESLKDNDLPDPDAVAESDVAETDELPDWAQPQQDESRPRERG